MSIKIIAILVLMGLGAALCLFLSWWRRAAAWGNRAGADVTLGESELRVHVADAPIDNVCISLNDAYERRLPILAKGLNVIRLDEFVPRTNAQPTGMSDITTVRIEGMIEGREVIISVPFKANVPLCTETVLRLGRGTRKDTVEPK